MITLLAAVNFAITIFKLLSGSMEDPMLSALIMTVINTNRMMHVHFQSD